MANALVMNISAGTAASALNGGLGGSAANQTSPVGFVAALSKVMGNNGSSTGTSMNDLSLSLASLLGGLVPTLTAVPQQEQGQGQVTASELADRITDMLESNPELIAQLVAMPQMQQWLLQAQSLLESSGASTAIGGIDVTLGSSKSNPLLPFANADIPAGQAKDVIVKLLTAVKQESGSVLFNQLLQDLAAVVDTVTQMQKPSAAGEQAVSAAQAGTTEQLQGNTTRKPTTDSTLKKNAVATLQTDMTGQTRIVFSTKPQSAASKLELLAAKSALALSQSLLSQDSNEDDNSPLLSLDDTTSLTAFPLADQTLLQTMRDTLQKAAAPVATNARQFVQDMSQFVVRNFQVIETGALSEAKLSLSPANLGQVDVKISMHAGQIVAHFVAQTVSGKEMLESQLPQLRQTLQNLGLQVERLDVSQGTTLESGMFQDGRGQQSFQQSGKQNQGRMNESELPEDFAKEMQTIAELRNLAYGTQFNVTA